MDTITLIQKRNSVPLLKEPAPNKEERKAIFQAALRAPDHGRLRPWKFQVVEGLAREELGSKMASAAKKIDPTMSDSQIEKLLKAPLRAPLIIIVSAKLQNHPKVPEVEQLLSAGSAVTKLQLANESLGYSSIWRTGSIVYNRAFMDSIGLLKNEQIVGMIYIGTASSEKKKLPNNNIDDFFEEWSF